MKRASDGAITQSAEVRRIVKELQDTTSQRYLVVRASRYENLLRASPATYAGTRGHLLAFTEELVLHRRAAATSRSSQSASAAAPNNVSGSSGAPIRLEYKDIVDVQADGSRLTIQLNATDKTSNVDLALSGQAPLSLLSAALPSTPSVRPSAGDSAEIQNRIGWFQRGWRGICGLFMSQSDPQPAKRPAPPPSNRGRRVSRLGSDLLFGAYGSETVTPNALLIDLDSSQACSQMQV